MRTKSGIGIPAQNYPKNEMRRLRSAQSASATTAADNASAGARRGLAVGLRLFAQALRRGDLCLRMLGNAAGKKSGHRLLYDPCVSISYRKYTQLSHT